MQSNKNIIRYVQRRQLIPREKNEPITTDPALNHMTELVEKCIKNCVTELKSNTLTTPNAGEEVGQ